MPADQHNHHQLLHHQWRHRGPPVGAKVHRSREREEEDGEVAVVDLLGEDAEEVSFTVFDVLYLYIIHIIIEQYTSYINSLVSYNNFQQGVVEVEVVDLLFLRELPFLQGRLQNVVNLLQRVLLVLV